jgi:acyl transferase domain-containing protein
VVLKRLGEAFRDRDNIRAIIKGWAMNNDGRIKVGYTAPSIDGQAEVIAMAHARANVDPASITYIEAHGTGTQMGDPIEIAALTQAFRQKTNERQYCAIGSVKSNFGHLDPAAGIAGLIKTVLSLEQKSLPASLHYHSANPQINFAESPFFVNHKLQEWTEKRGPLRAGVSSFGIGGTNVHVVLEQAPRMPESNQPLPSHLLVLSARSSAALDTTTDSLLEFLTSDPSVNLGDVAFTLQVGRSQFPHRRAVPCRDQADAIAVLSERDPSRIVTGVAASRPLKMAFLFPGQGAQYVRMCEELYKLEPLFARHVNECAALLNPALDEDLISLLYPSNESEQEANALLTQTAFCQPALFVVEYALAQLWGEWGIRPTAMLGHSIGEYVAACLSGVLPLETALRLVATRARLMQDMPTGAMLAVFTSEQRIEAFLAGSNVSLAAVNGPLSSVISGSKEAISGICSKLNQAGIGYRYLQTSHGFHSEMMDPVMPYFVDLVKSVVLGAPRIPYVSNVTGNWIETAAVQDPRYWGTHLRQTVRFGDGVQRLIKEGFDVLLEVGPGAQLCRLARQQEPGQLGPVIVPSSRDPRDPVSDLTALQNALARVWVAGIEVPWERVNKDKAWRRTRVPRYPFEHQSYWIYPSPSDRDNGAEPGLAPRKPNIAECFYAPMWVPATVPEAVFQAEKHLDLCWLLFIDDGPLGDALVKLLRESRYSPILVRPGDCYSQYNGTEYVINPSVPAQYEELLRGLLAAKQGFNRILHLWTVKPQTRVLESGFHSLLLLARAIGRVAPAMSVRMAVFSAGAYRVSPEDMVYPELATILGATTVIPQEYPNIGCKTVDLDAAAFGQVDCMVAELDFFDYPRVAYRGTRRFGLKYEPIQIQSTQAPLRRLRENGVYLITGGLGGIGLVIARCLVEQAKAKLVLVGRSKFPERAHWDDWLKQQGADDQTSSIILALRELERLGGEVSVMSADVASHEGMQEVFTETLKKFGTLNGIIHAAGIPGGRLIEFTTELTGKKVLCAKVEGTRVLEKLLEATPVDFLVLFSSLASIQGGVGQADYCAANAFLDAYAWSRTGVQSPFTVSINWPTWREVGMAVKTPLPPDMERNRKEWLSHGIEPWEGASAFLSILGSEFPQVVVSTFPSQPAHGARKTYGRPQASTRTKSRSMLPVHPRPKLPVPYAPTQTHLQGVISSIWQEVLGVAPIGIHDNFFELGGHSLLALKVASRIFDALNLQVPATAVFEAPTVGALSQILEHATAQARGISEHLDTIDLLSPEDVKRLLSESETQPNRPGTTVRTEEGAP